MKRSISDSPTTSTAPVVVSKRALSEGDAPTQDDETIDLVYPFDWPSVTEGNDTGNGGTGGDTGSGGGGSGGTVSVPIDPNGPIFMSTKGLNVYTSPPITIASRSITLSYDNLSLSKNAGKLQCKTVSPLVITSNGIGISIDPKSFSISDSNLSLNFSPSGCIFSNENGIQLNFNSNVFSSDSSVLTLKINPSSCIVSSSDGIGINVDNAAFEISGNTLYLKSNPNYLSPYTICTLGDPKFGTGGTNYCASDKGSKWNCKMYVYMVYSAGIVNGLINTYVNSNNTDINSSSSAYRVNFTTIITTSTDSYENISNFYLRSISPSSSSYNIFNPSSITNQGFNSISPPEPSSSYANWYISPSGSGFKTIYFYPIPNGTKFNESSMSYGIATLVKSDGSTSNVLAITYNMIITSNYSWYNTSATFTTGSIPFTYQGYIPNGIQTTP